MKGKIILRIILFLVIGFVFSQKVFAEKKKNPTNTDLNNTEKTELQQDTITIRNAISAPIVVEKDTLFYVYGNIGVVTALSRAQIISDNIIELCKDPFFKPDSLVIVDDSGIYQIQYSGKTIMGITDYQAKVLKKTKEEIAITYKSIIINKIDFVKKNNSWKNILLRIALSILVLLITVFLIKALNTIFRKLVKIIGGLERYTLKAIYYIIDAEKQIKLLQLIIKLIKLTLDIVILYFSLFTLFRIFPQTKWLSDRLLGYILSPLDKAFDSFINFIPDLITIIITFLIFRFIVKILKMVANKIDDGSITFRGFYKDWAIPTFNIIKVVLYIFMFIIIFPHLPGSDSDIFKGVSVFLGVLFSLGSTSVIGNVVSGLVITYMRPFKIGDRIKMGEFLGNVIEKTPLVTRIKTPKNEMITIPNASIMTAQTINYTNSANEYGLILYATITVGYDIPWRKVHELLIEAGTKTPNVLTKPKPFVLQIALDDFYVKYEINVYTKDANEMSNIYSDLNKNIHDIFLREGIELLSPHYHAQRDGSELVMPKESIKDQKYHTPPFKVHIVKEEEPQK